MLDDLGWIIRLIRKIRSKRFDLKEHWYKDYIDTRVYFSSHWIAGTHWREVKNSQILVTKILYLNESMRNI